MGVKFETKLFSEKGKPPEMCPSFGGNVGAELLKVAVIQTHICAKGKQNTAELGANTDANLT